MSPAAIKQYMFGTEVNSAWREGAPITWKGNWKGKPYEDKGTIRRIEPEARLEYTHFSPLSGQPDRPENYHTVIVELAEEGDGTRLSLSQDGNADEDGREHAEENWKAMLAGLKKYVERT